jgi:hypothetical protein
MTASILANLPAAVPFGAHDPLGSAPGAAGPLPIDGPKCHELFEHYRLGSLPRYEDKGHQLAISSGPQVDFSTELAVAAAEGFSFWSLFLPLPCAGGPGSWGHQRNGRPIWAGPQRRLGLARPPRAVPRSPPAASSKSSWPRSATGRSVPADCTRERRCAESIRSRLGRDDAPQQASRS